MGRIKIVRTVELPRRAADIVLHEKKTLEGADISKMLNVGTKKSIDIIKVEKPDECPYCLAEGTIVNYHGSEGHFRCRTCGHIFG